MDDALVDGIWRSSSPMSAAPAAAAAMMTVLRLKFSDSSTETGKVMFSFS